MFNCFWRESRERCCTIIINVKPFHEIISFLNKPRCYANNLVWQPRTKFRYSRNLRDSLDVSYRCKKSDFPDYDSTSHSYRAAVSSVPLQCSTDARLNTDRSCMCARSEITGPSNYRLGILFTLYDNYETREGSVDSGLSSSFDTEKATAICARGSKGKKKEKKRKEEERHEYVHDALPKPEQTLLFSLLCTSGENVARAIDRTMRAIIDSRSVHFRSSFFFRFVTRVSRIIAPARAFVLVCARGSKGCPERPARKQCRESRWKLQRTRKRHALTSILVLSCLVPRLLLDRS